ncbi:MAG: hypothetical protein IT532_17785 [Burkholderiales bacterium]|nr:hypothetical protein [Burkholderiales bacterium]
MPVFLQRLLLVIVLLFSQQVAFAHALDHQLAGTTSDQQACEQCARAVQLGGTPTSSTSCPDHVTSHAAPAAPADPVFLTGAFAPFSSRAPPVSS